MGTVRQNQHIARLIVGAMSIDGSLNKTEREKVAQTLAKMGMDELIADVGAAIEDYDGTFNMFQDCRALVESLGSHAKELAPDIFRIVADVIASDRFVSSQEAAYLSGLAKRLQLSPEQAKTALKSVMAERRGRLEVAASGVDEMIHPALKELLSFDGAEDLVGAAQENSIEEMMFQAQEAMREGEKVSFDDVARAMTILGLSTNATLEDAKEVWRDAIENLNLGKLVNMGETFVTSAINRITRINDAFKTILHFHEKMEAAVKKPPAAPPAEKKDIFEDL